jgi:hypothetical protein
MTNPQRFINRTILFLVLAAVVVVALREIIVRAFLYNPWLNGLILGVLLLGIAYNIRRMLRLKPEVQWIEAYRTAAPGFSMLEPPRLLTPIAAALGERERRRGRMAFSTMSLRYLLDSVSFRLDESRDIASYLRNLLIFLGLLGTFWGLLEAIGAISGVIASMAAPSSGDLVALFNEVIGRLAGPLSGMGTAFSASMFGLAGSLMLGFLDLQASQAQNAFYNDLEEWLSGLTRLAGAEGPLAEGAQGAAMPAYLGAMLQQTADNLDRIQQLLVRSEENRGELHNAVGTLSQRLAALSDRLTRDQDLVERLLGGQQEMLRQMAHRADGSALDPATREHIRNTDVQLGRLIEELGRGRNELSRELRNEIKLVARTIAIVAGEPEVVRE